MKQLPYPKTNQERTGFMKENSSNKENRRGGKDGTGGGQPTTGHKSEVSRPSGRKGAGSKQQYGMEGGQGNTGVTETKSTNPGHNPPARTDEITEISN